MVTCKIVQYKVYGGCEVGRCRGYCSTAVHCSVFLKISNHIASAKLWVPRHRLSAGYFGHHCIENTESPFLKLHGTNTSASRCNLVVCSDKWLGHVLHFKYPNLIFLVHVRTCTCTCTCIQWFSIFTIMSMSSFSAFLAISLKFVRRNESVRQRKHWVGHKNCQKHRFCDQPKIPLSHWLSARN